MNAIPETDEPLTLSQLLGILRGRWKLLLITTLVGAAAGTAAGVLMQSVYRSTVLLMPTQSNERSGLLGSVLGGIGGGGGLISSLGIGAGNEGVTSEALALLNSRQFIEEFIENHHLMGVLYPKLWDDVNHRWKATATNPPTPWKAFKVFTTGILDVTQDKKNNLVTVRIDWTDRDAAAVWANDLVDMVNERVRARAIDDADKTISYLEQELKNAEAVEIRAALFNMIESQLKIKAVATVRRQYVFQVLDPAAPADADVRLRPHPRLYALIGLAVGFMLGAAFAILARGSGRSGGAAA
jgi:uncharacterized protein involved in exopolysaccharide biosynthesis